MIHVLSESKVASPKKYDISCSLNHIIIKLGH